MTRTPVRAAVGQGNQLNAVRARSRVCGKIDTHANPRDRETIGRREEDMYPEDSDRIRRMTPEERSERRRALTKAPLMGAHHPGIYEQLELLDALDGRLQPKTKASGWALLAFAIVAIIATLYAVNGG